MVTSTRAFEKLFQGKDVTGSVRKMINTLFILVIRTVLSNRSHGEARSFKITGARGYHTC